jgi:serine protease
MKTIYKFIVALSLLVASGFTTLNQSRSDQYISTGNEIAGIQQNDREPRFVQGAITIKLKPGRQNYERQTGTVYFGVKSLDDKVAQFRIDNLEKRFHYNPIKLRDGMPDLSRIYKISFPAEIPVNDVVSAFALDSNVEYAEPIPINQAFDVPNDALYSQLMHLPQIHAPEAWNIHKGENGPQDVVIAIDDTGIDWKHPDLQSNIWQNLAEDADGDGHTLEYNGLAWVLDPGDINGIDDDGNGHVDDLIGWNFAGNNNNPQPYPANPLGFHGTHCAGIAGGVTNNGSGIASISWNVKVMPLCIDSNNTDPWAYDGLLYAAENGADIISCSWGSLGYSTANQEAVTYATSLGSIVVAAVGNNKSYIKIYPADYHDVIAVTAVSADDTKAWYANFNSFVDIAAPGGDHSSGILSTLPGGTYGLDAGTSMSAPLIAGCFALLKSYHPDWTNSQLITQILGTADNIDSLNPQFATMIGSGRVNAYRMLSEQNVNPFLKLELISVATIDQNGNGINEPGEDVTLNFNLYNHMPTSGTQNANVTLSSSDQDLIFVKESCTASVPADNSFAILNQLKVHINPNATCHFATIHVHFDAGLPIISGQDFDIQLLVNPSGILVYEGKQYGKDYSGTYIGNILNRLGYSYTYSNTLTSLLGFETVFLSFGNYDWVFDQSTPFTQDQSSAIQHYLEQGGKLYLEMGGMYYRINNSGFNNMQAMKDLFGISIVAYGNGENRIDTLLGMQGTATQNMSFRRSDQGTFFYIDKLYPKATASAVFKENGYGNVGVMFNGSGSHGQKTFYMGYALADLHDRDTTSSRNMILLKTLRFFNFTLPTGYLLTNFTEDKTAGAVPLQVHFKDISIGDPSHPVNSWQWDFNGDGVTDSYEQNPVWTFNEPGPYSVKLITSNGIKTDFMVYDDIISANSGYLVYEGIPDGLAFSGSYIRDYIQNQGLPVSYRNVLPDSLDGYSAVFLSFGNAGSGNVFLDNQMARTLTSYLHKGGFVYLDGGDALGWDQATNIQLLNLFGLQSSSDGGLKRISDLEGQSNSLTQDIVFTGSNQLSEVYIDQYIPQPNGAMAAFIENDYGTVAVQSEVTGGRRTFCFSYAIADLVDGQYPNTRDELMHRILGFFDMLTTVPDRGNLASKGYSIYPNPVSDRFTIQATGDLSQNTTMTIYSIDGRQIESKQLPEPTTVVNVSDLPTGVYIVKVMDGQSEQIVKVLKE